MKHDRMDETPLMMGVLDDGERVEEELDVEFTPDRSRGESAYMTRRKPVPVYTEAGSLVMY